MRMVWEYQVWGLWSASVCHTAQSVGSGAVVLAVLQLLVGYVDGEGAVVYIYSSVYCDGSGWGLSQNKKWGCCWAEWCLWCESWGCCCNCGFGMVGWCLCHHRSQRDDYWMVVLREIQGGYVWHEWAPLCIGSSRLHCLMWMFYPGWGWTWAFDGSLIWKCHANKNLVFKDNIGWGARGIQASKFTAVGPWHQKVNTCHYNQCHMAGTIRRKPGSWDKFFFLKHIS